MEYTEILSKIKSGALPNIVGACLTEAQVKELVSELDSRKKQIDEYISAVIVPRLCLHQSTAS